MSEFKYIQNSLAFCFSVDQVIAPVVFHSRSHIETQFCAKVLQASRGRFGVNENLTARRCEWGLIEVERTVEVFPHGNARVDGQLPEKVNVSLACGRRRSHRLGRKDSSIPARMERK